MREVRNPLDAEHQRCPDPGERQDRARDQSIYGQLYKLFQQRGHAGYIRATAPSRLKGPTSRLGWPSTTISAASRPSTGDRVNPQPPATTTNSFRAPTRCSGPMNPTRFQRPVAVVMPAQARISGTSRSAGTTSVATAALPANER